MPCGGGPAELVCERGIVKVAWAYKVDAIRDERVGATFVVLCVVSEVCGHSCTR